MTTRDEILSFKNLEEGWCYLEGGPLQDSTVEKALWLLEAAGEGYKTNAFPGLGGEIELSIVKGIRSLDIIMESNEQCTAVCEIFNKELFYKEELTVDEAKQEILNFCKRE